MSRIQRQFQKYRGGNDTAATRPGPGTGPGPGPGRTETSLMTEGTCTDSMSQNILSLSSENGGFNSTNERRLLKDSL